MRIPPDVALSARLAAGQAVEVSTREGRMVIKGVDASKRTLAEKLAAFDPALHGGEVMTTKRRLSY